MDIVTYKAIHRLWRTLGFMAGGAVIFGIASSHCYDRQKKQLEDLKNRIEILEGEITILKLKNERT